MDCSSPRPPDGWPALRDSADPLLGRTVDRRFFVTRRVAQLGVATLYRASCLTVPHHFGLWICPLDAFGCSRDRLVEQMQREVHRVRALDSPHVAHIHEFLELPGDRAAVVMDHCEGTPLSAFVDARAPLAIERACELGAQLARALHEAHQAELVHRQLDPTAILVEQPAGGAARLRLLGLGLPRVNHGPEAARAATRFWSPEQAHGERADTTSNAFGVGALLYFLLTGEPPHTQWSASDSWGVRRAARVSKARQRQDVPAALDDLVAALLCEKRARRPQSLEAAICCLEKITSANPPRGDGAAASSAGDDDSVVDVPEELLGGGNFFALSEQTSVIDPDRAFPYTSASLDDLSLSRTLETRLASDDLPDDLGPSSSVAFWSEASRTTGNFGWVNQQTTGVRPHAARLDPQVCAVSSDGSVLAATDADDALWHGPVADIQRIERIAAFDATPRALCTMHRCVLVGDDDGNVLRHSLSGQTPQTLLQTVDRSAIVALAADSQTQDAVAAAAAGRVYVAKLDGQMCDEDWRRVRSKEPALDVAVAARAETFAVLRAGGAVELRHLRRPQTLLATFRCTENCRAIALSNDGQLVALICAKKVRLHHGYSGQLVAAFNTLRHKPRAVFFGDNNDLYGICHVRRELTVWNLATDAPAHINAHEQRRT